MAVIGHTLTQKGIKKAEGKREGENKNPEHVERTVSDSGPVAK